jgi:hypothetical protein
MKVVRWAPGYGKPDQFMRVLGTLEDGSIALSILNGDWRHWPIEVQTTTCLVEVPLDELPEQIRAEIAEKDY